MPNGRKEDRILCTKENEHGWSPEEIVNLDALVDKCENALGQRERDFLYEFVVWIYRAISRFDETHPGSDIVWRRYEKQSAGFRRRYETNTLLDVILALIRFNRDNQDYFTFKVKEKHSGVHKINWTRTISKTVAFMQDGVPLYLEPRTKKKAVNFDEELLVIFYSILDYVNRQYNFKVQFNLGYELIPSAEFKRYLSGYGEVRLRQIKYKYFSDRDLALWELCFAFFHKAHKANVEISGEEYLLAKDFNIVFEAMIDELVGSADLAGFKELADGKELDHLYVDESLTRRTNRKTLYIADSKYYKVGEALSANGECVAKQFTYAKNMLQLNMNLFLPGDSPKDVTQSAETKRKPFKDSGIGLQRDNVTEGYDVIPNFFISANMSKDFSYDNPELEWRGHDKGGEFRKAYRKAIIEDLIKRLEYLQDRTSENIERIRQIDKEIADLSAQNLVVSRLHTSGVIDAVEYTKQTSQLGNKIMTLRAERRKKLNESEGDVQLDDLKNLNEIIEEHILKSDFDEELFEDIVEKIIVDDNTKITFHLIGGLTLTEEIKEKGRCKTA